MNWLQRLRAWNTPKQQTITLELTQREWAELKEWAKSSNWTVAYTVTKWVRNRMHGVGVIGN